MKFIIIDGYGFVFRAYHSLPPLTNPNGEPIGAVYGFTSMLYKFLSQHVADYITVALDSSQKSFRHDLYPQYKANRPPAPDDLIPQFPIISEAIEAFNIKPIAMPGFEADDIIAYLSREAEKQGMEVIIVSSDKDLMQLISKKTKMLDAMRDKQIDEQAVLEKFGVMPDKVVEVLSLMGDSSDNIPGVRGIGPKTASELINQFGSLEGVYENLDKIPQQKRRELLTTCRENAFLSKKLVQLNYDLKTELSLDDFKVKDADKEVLATFLHKHGFKALLAKLGSVSLEEPNKESNIPVTFQQVSTDKDFKELIQKITRQGVFSIYLDANEVQLSSVDNWKISFSNEQNDLFANHQNSLNEIFKKLAPLFSDKSIIVYGHDLKELYKTLNKIGIILTNFHDVLVMAYCLDSGNHNSTLKTLLERFTSTDSIVSSSSLFTLARTINQKLIDHKVCHLYQTIDRPIQKVLADIELKGVKIDSLKLKELTATFEKKAEQLQRAIFDLAGTEFNIASPKQLAEILFDKLNLSTKQSNKKKSTNSDILDELAANGYEIAKLILQWRQFKKLTSTYTEPLPKAINPFTGRIHTTLISTATTTGRLSSHNPNLQNIPIRNNYGQMLRSTFIAEPGNLILSADYSQIELRLLAEMGKVTKLIDAFTHGYDIHAATASEVFAVDLKNVDSELRRKAKTINFGIIYGISAFGLSERLGIDHETARRYIELYFSRYPEINSYMQKTIEFARETGFVKTIFGRKCSIKGINDKNFSLRSFAERAAINAPLQGTASDIIKLAMINLPEEVKKYMVLQVHDELVFELPESKCLEYAAIIKQCMESVAKFSIPMTVDIKYGKNWSDAHG